MISRSLFPWLTDATAHKMLTSELTYETATGLGLLLLLAIGIFLVADWRAMNTPKEKVALRFSAELAAALRYQRWIAKLITPYLGPKVLEIGGGLGSLVRELPPRVCYDLSDIDSTYITAIQPLLATRPNLHTFCLDIRDELLYQEHKEQYDTVICLNVLEHILDDTAALKHIFQLIRPGGNAVLIVPQSPCLYGSFDELSGHYRRYTQPELQQLLTQTGFIQAQFRDVNRASVLGWWLNSCILHRTHFGRWQIRLVNICAPLFRRLDRILPWKGLSILAIAYRPSELTPPGLVGTLGGWVSAI